MSLLTNLIAFWAMDEASGNALDSHTNSLTLTDNASVGSGTGVVSGARSFTATSSQFFSRTSETLLQAGDIDFTFQVWFRMATGGNWVILGKDVDTPANSRDYTIDLANSGTDVRFYINGGGAGLTATWPAALSITTWYHLLCWHDSVNNLLGITVDNGTPATQTTSGTAPEVSSAQFRIGARAYSGFEGYFDGLIDGVAFWKRMLTTQERTDLYNGGAGLSYAGMGGGVTTPRYRLRFRY